jgi:hypothetical protein
MKKFVKVLLLLIFVSVIAIGGYSWVKKSKPLIRDLCLWRQ